VSVEDSPALRIELLVADVVVGDGKTQCAAGAARRL
jgi:hypothetical protein